MSNSNIVSSPSNRSVMRDVLGSIAVVLISVAPARADTLKVMAAGSLRPAITELLQSFPLQLDAADPPEFGPSGLLRQKIEGGAAVDIFASADMEQPRRLAAGHP